MSKTPGKRPWQRVMDDFETGRDGSLDEHLAGCAVAYQASDRGMGAAVYAALEMLSGVAIHYRQLEQSGLGRDLPGPDGTLNGNVRRAVPWFAVAALCAAWEDYKAKGPPLGKAFRLEGSQGKRPVIEQMQQLLDQRAIAHFVAIRTKKHRAAGSKRPVQEAKGDAANYFGVSDETIDKAWKKVRRSERERASKGA